ncbi:hypothetical protein Q4Q35_00985 [Flavivirga aquimarina]|uniref:Uncharacterized protein n=1 Tax=Flavivirga aquimarina TaxID=2027862 RepID=A0ABT8W5H6_9FLAO|nr:hypothetical protein [Flavivirga aquimarina]MDO5968370.1 hypothetical protein [Flavivirga aquimarina]
MKYIISFIVVLFSANLYSQINENLLSESIITTELLFNGKCIQDIDQTNGENIKMQNLFGNGLTTQSQITETGTQLTYYGDGIEFTFLKNDDTGSVFLLRSVTVNSNTPIVKLQTNVISVNNSINVLGNVANSSYNNEHYILYKSSTPIDITLIINYNNSTNKISSIEFNNQLAL